MVCPANPVAGTSRITPVYTGRFALSVSFVGRYKMITDAITVRYIYRLKTGNKTEVGNADKYYTVIVKLIEE